MTATFKPYPKYKPSGVEWLGDIPEHWGSHKFKHLFTEKPIVNGSDLPAGAISFGEVIFKSEEKLTPQTKSSYQEVRAGEFLVNPINLNYDLKSLRTALSSIDTCVSSAYIVLQLNNRKPVNPVYMKLLLHLFDIHHMKTLGAGVRQTINFADIGSCITHLPDVPEQTAIANFLDEETRKIDEISKEFDNLVALANEEISTMVFSSEKAKTMRLSLATVEVSRPIPSAGNESYTKIGLYNRGRGLFHKDPSNADDMGDSDFFFVEEGDCIISGQFAWEGAVALADKEDTGCVVSHRYPVIRGKEGVALTEYIYALLCTAHGNFLLNDHSRGAAGRNRPLNIGTLLKETVSIPDMATQERVAKAVHKRREVLKEVKQMKAYLDEYRTSLIHEAVTGKIDLRKA